MRKWRQGEPRPKARRGRSVLKCAVAALAIAAPAAAQTPSGPFADLLACAEASSGGDCRAGIIEHRINEWLNRPPVMPAFETIEETISDVMDPVQRLEARGCNLEFLWSR